MSISLKQFLSDLADCLGWPYVSPGGTGKDCSASGIDCSGMIVRAYKLQGAKIYHGSNTIWRDGSLSSKGKLTSVSQLQPGYAVFKWSSTDTAKYPDGQGDFHHIGVVESVSPLKIIHASSAKGKVVEDTSIKAWSHWGKLAKVDYGEAATVSEVDTVSGAAPSVSGIVIGSGRLNMRKKPSKSAAYIVQIEPGETVTILKTNCGASGWYYISYGKYAGYVMSKFIQTG